MNTVLKVSKVQKFQTRFYPECDTARLLCELAKQTSFTKENIELLKQIGFTVESVPSSAPLGVL